MNKFTFDLFNSKLLQVKGKDEEDKPTYGFYKRMPGLDKGT